jgi:hypothetical protein
MVNGYQVIENILTKDEEDFLETYVKNESLAWNSTDNINGPFGGKIGKINFPAKVLFINPQDQELFNISQKIQKLVCNKINLDFLQTYRCKINHTTPLGVEYNPLDLMHIDMKMNHMAIVYYINDSDGDTVIFNNKEGNNMSTMLKHINGVQVNDFTQLKTISPQKGRLVVFDGNLYHYGDYPKSNERYVINIDFAAIDKNKKTLI